MTYIKLKALIEWNTKQGKHYFGSTLHSYYKQSAIELKLLEDLMCHIDQLPDPDQDPHDLRKDYIAWCADLDGLLP